MGGLHYYWLSLRQFFWVGLIIKGIDVVSILKGFVAIRIVKCPSYWLKNKLYFLQTYVASSRILKDKNAEFHYYLLLPFWNSEEQWFFFTWGKNPQKCHKWAFLTPFACPGFGVIFSLPDLGNLWNLRQYSLSFRFPSPSLLFRVPNSEVSGSLVELNFKTQSNNLISGLYSRKIVMAKNTIISEANWDLCFYRFCT